MDFGGLVVSTIVCVLEEGETKRKYTLESTKYKQLIGI